MKARSAKNFLESPYPYILLFAIGGAFLHTGLTNASNNLQEIQKPYNPPSDYVSVSVRETGSQKWGENIVLAEAWGKTRDSWKSTRGFKPIAESGECSTTISPFLTGSYYGGDGKDDVVVHTFLPGGGELEVERFKKDFSSCGGAIKESVVSDNGVNRIVYEIGERKVFFAGDTAVSVSASLVSNESLVEKVNVSLLDSGCISSDVSYGLEESPFLKGESKDFKYEGRIVSENVYTTIDYTKAPVLTGVSKSVVSETVEKPEEPLPENFKNLPTPVKEPGILPVLTVPESIFEKADYYREDVFGRGCGWKWSGLSKPLVENTTTLQSLEEQAKQNALSKADSRAGDLVESYAKQSLAKASEAKKILFWNKYVEESANVYRQWATLELQREKIKPSWDKWVYEYRVWRDYDRIVKKAEELYSKEVEQCSDFKKQLKEWESKVLESGDSVQAPHLVCPTVPEKPFVLRSDRLLEPSPYKVPEGVTIPLSWEKEKDAPLTDEEILSYIDSVQEEPAEAE